MIGSKIVLQFHMFTEQIQVLTPTPTPLPSEQCVTYPPPFNNSIKLKNSSNRRSHFLAGNNYILNKMSIQPRMKHRETLDNISVFESRLRATFFLYSFLMDFN
jgi:hypothetical protein